MSLEQPAWEGQTARFYVSIPVIANNPPGCNYGQLAGATTCDGGLLVIDPSTATTELGAFNGTTGTGPAGCSPAPEHKYSSCIVEP